MKTLVTTATTLLFTASLSLTAQVIISDDFNVNSGTTRGFDFDNGINFGINPALNVTRLTGTLAPDLHYIYTQNTNPPATYKAWSNYRIPSSGKAQVGGSSYAGRFSIADATGLYNFSTALGSASATIGSPSIYDVRISMASTLAGTQRFSFGLSTTEAGVDSWDFGIQLYKTSSTAASYEIGRVINTDSSGVANFKSPITTSLPYASGTELNFRMRFTDAGAEADAAFNSRVQLFIDDVEIYDTESDTLLPSGWRFDSADRFFVFDQAGASGVAGVVTYDNFSVEIVPEPSVAAFGLLGLAAMLIRRRG